MMTASDPLNGKLQRAGITLILGLLVEGLCLLSKGPVAFILFVGVGGVLIAAGILLYLHSVVSSVQVAKS
jgi:hypothetical protein